MPKYTLHVNGNKHEVTVDADTPLLWVLRDELDLVGTKYGCGIAQCGACTVHYNGEAVRSCSLPISAVADGKVTTIEGLSEEVDHVIQQAWREHDVPQCGYCQAGQMMHAAAFLKENPSPSEEAIENATNAILCRCGTYNKIKAALKTAANS